MNRPGVPPVDLRTIETALSGFSIVVINGGKRLFEEGRVRSVDETARPNTYQGEVHEKDGKTYQVTLSFGKSASNLLCTCRIGTECKHVYSALLFLSKRFRKQVVVLNKEDKKAEGVADYFSLVTDPTLLTEKLTDFVERLEELFQTYGAGNQINGRILKGLFPDWPAEEYWTEIKIASGEPLSRVQLWHFLVTNLQQRGLKVPSLFGDLNETIASKSLIEKWIDSQETQKWVIRYERSNEPVVYQRFVSEFRWAMDGRELCLEVKPGGDLPFRPLRSEELSHLATEWRSGRLQISSESLLLLMQHFLADGYLPPARLSLGSGLAGRLNGLFQSDEIRRRTVGSNGKSLQLERSTAGWEMLEASEFLYRFQLMHQGQVPDTTLLMLPGPTTLYWFGSTLLEAGPPPFPVDSLECNPVVEVPRAAVESVPGIRYLADSVAILPDSLARRVTSIQPKRVLKVRHEPTESGESIGFVPQLVDPRNGMEIQSSDEFGWNLSGKQIVQEGDHFVVYQLPEQTDFGKLFAKLPAAFSKACNSRLRRRRTALTRSKSANSSFPTRCCSIGICRMSMAYSF